MVGLVKQSLFKVTRRAKLTKKEPEESLLNREGNTQIPVLTPNTLLYGQPIMIPDERLDEDTPEIKRHQSYITKCKEATKKIWKKSFCDPFEKGTISCITQRR